MENRRFLHCRTFSKVPSPLTIENPGPRTLKNFSPVSELALDLSSLSTGNHDSSPYGTPRRCVRVIQAQKTANTAPPKVQLWRPRALKKPLCGTMLDFMDSPENPPSYLPINNSTIIRNEKSPKEMKKSSAFRRFQELSPVPPPLCDFDACSPCGEDVRCSDSLSPDSVSQTGSLSPLCSVDSPAPSISSLPKLSLDISPSPPPAQKISKPSADDDETSQDSGVNMDGIFEFKFPTRTAVRPNVLGSKDLCFSPATFMSSPITPTSPQSLSFSSPSPDLLVDDGFHELEEKNSDAPAGMSALIHGPMITKEKQPSNPIHMLGCTPNRSLKTRVDDARDQARRGLFRSPSAPKLSLQRQNSVDSSDLTTSFRFTKRLEREDDVITRPLLKRRKSCLSTTKEDSSENQENNPPVQKKKTPKLQRCQSEQLIKSALRRADDCEITDSPLTGDFSQKHCLPMCHSKQQDLMAITPNTMADLMDGKYDDEVNKFVIVDCRYPYEFDGGHIKGAVNIYTKMDIYSTFMEKGLYRQPKDAKKRNIIIFHCEFSSERGPKMNRFLRNKDRDANLDCYPTLNYPELYLLEGGYKCFWEQHKDKCTKDGAYKPMLHEDHNDDLKKFRIKSNSWAGEKCDGPGKTRTALKKARI